MGPIGWLCKLCSVIGTLAATVYPCPGWGPWFLGDHQGPFGSDGSDVRHEGGLTEGGPGLLPPGLSHVPANPTMLCAG